MDHCTEHLKDHPNPRYRALRVVLEHRNGEINVISTERQAMLPPPPQALFPSNPGAGAWIELRDDDNNPIYRRAIHDPLQGLEIVTDSLNEPLSRITNTDLSTTFFFILPDISGARRLLFSTSNASVASKGSRMSHVEPVIFEFDLSDVDKEGNSHGRE